MVNKWMLRLLWFTCLLGILTVIHNTANAEVMRIGKYGKIVNTPQQLQTKAITASEALAPTTKDFSAKVEASNYTAFSDKATGKVRFDDGKDWLVMSVRDTKGLVIDYKSTQFGIKEYITVAEKVDTITIIYDITSSCTETKWKDDGTLVFINPTTGNDIALAKPFVMGQDAKVTATYDKGVYTLVIDAKELKFPVVIDPSINADDVDATSGYALSFNANWLTARKATVADGVDAAKFIVGSRYASSWWIQRALMRYTSSSLGTAAVIDFVKLKVVAGDDSSITDFNLKLVAADAGLSTSDFTTAQYNDFAGWVSKDTSWDGDVTYISDTAMSTAGKTKGDTLTFTFNAAGIARIAKGAGAVTQFYVMSENDIKAQPPTDVAHSEYLAIEDDSSYLLIYYHYVAPTAATISNKTQTTATISWTDNSALEDSFQVYNASGNTWVASVDSTHSSYNITGLTQGTAYTFYVKAKYGTATSDSTAVTFTTTCNYYVDDTGGLDANDGKTTGAAWKTIDKVNDSTFAPGDSILLNRGETWDETLTIPSSGTAALPIVFSSYSTGDKPIIDGSDTRAMGIYATGKSYVTIDGLAVKAMAKTGDSYGIHFLGGSHNTVKNCTVSEIYYVTNPGGTSWEIMRGRGIYFRQSDNATINGNTVTDCGGYGIIVATSGAGNDIDSLDIYNNDVSNMNHGIAVALDGTGADITGGRVYNNTIHDHNNYYVCDAWHRDAIFIFGRTSNTTDWVQDIEIYKNYMYDTTNQTLGGTATIYISSSTKDLKIHHNIMDYMPGNSSIEIRYGVAGYSGGHEIYNNTIATEKAGISIYSARGCKVKNNIIYSKGYPYLIRDADAKTDLDLDYNVVSRAYVSQVSFAYAYPVYYANMTTWKAAGYDTHSYDANPLFAGGSGAAGFKLSISGSDTSQAIDHGVDLGFTTDYQDSTIPQGALPDMGAYEYLQSPGSPDAPSDAAEAHRITHVTLTWTPAAGNDSTQVYMSVNDGAYTWVDSKAIAIGTTTVRNLSAGTLYRFMLKTRKNSPYALSGGNVVSYTSPYYTLGRPKP